MEPIICTKGLTKTFIVKEKEEGFRGSIKQLFKEQKREVKAIDNLSICIEKGDTVGILGMNGAGKSTLIKLLTGIIAPTEGTVIVNGEDPYKKSYDFCKMVSLVSANKSQLHIDLCAKDNFLFLKEIYNISDTEYNQNVQELSKLLNLEKLLSRPIRKLSFGERIKVELVGALLHSPQIVFLDEPTIGMDIKAQLEVRDFLVKYAKERNRTILLTSHNLEDITSVCKKIAIINEGKLHYYGDINTFCEDVDGIMDIEIYYNYAGEDIVKLVEVFDAAFVEQNDNRMILRVEKRQVAQVLKDIVDLLGDNLNNIIIQGESLESMLRRKLLCN